MFAVPVSGEPPIGVYIAVIVVLPPFLEASNRPLVLEDELLMMVAASVLEEVQSHVFACVTSCVVPSENTAVANNANVPCKGTWMV